MSMLDHIHAARFDPSWRERQVAAVWLSNVLADWRERCFLALCLGATAPSIRSVADRGEWPLILGDKPLTDAAFLALADQFPVARVREGGLHA